MVSVMGAHKEKMRRNQLGHRNNTEILHKSVVNKSINESMRIGNEVHGLTYAAITVDYMKCLMISKSCMMLWKPFKHKTFNPESYYSVHQGRIRSSLKERRHYD